VRVGPTGDPVVVGVAEGAAVALGAADGLGAGLPLDPSSDPPHAVSPRARTARIAAQPAGGPGTLVPPGVADVLAPLPSTRGGGTATGPSARWCCAMTRS
jgi:hypothetical protein